MLIKIAFRNILRNRRRSAITLLVIVFGSIGLILFGGYKGHTFFALRESTIRTRLGHLQIFAKGYATSESQKPMAYALDDVASLRRQVEHDPRVKMTAAEITLMGLVSNGEKSETFIATAVEPAKDRIMNSQRMISGSPLSNNEPDSAILGAGLAKSMHVKAGDYVTLMTTTVTGSLNAMDVRVAGIFTIGVKEFDDRAIKMPIAGAQMLLQTKKVEKLLVFLNNTDDTAAVRESLSRSLHGVEFKDWSELATFYHQVVALYNGIFGFLGLIVFAIVIFSVANTIMMSVFERTREIGTLMAIGTTRARLWRMFLAEGFSIGLIGCVLGVASGVALAFLINHGNVMLPPPPGYTAGYKLQILISSSVLVPAAVIAIVTATLSSIAPAFRASRLKIVDALGHI
ncbi:MAG TPA: FtsX-like permease family protein [Thermoanaerobaculia bacterium]|jgi:putative ABC transport system permease protein|nr:FtsX-like permease family protein [Thermoanaerobaculia bacterium]